MPGCGKNYGPNIAPPIPHVYTVQEAIDQVNLHFYHKQIILLPFLTRHGNLTGHNINYMQKLSATQMKAFIGGDDNGIGTKGDTHSGNRGETGHGNRTTCTALIEYRHSNSAVFSRVSVCDAPGTTTRDGGTIVSCLCG